LFDLGAAVGEVNIDNVSLIEKKQLVPEVEVARHLG
jgi:hypothetical protein